MESPRLHVLGLLLLAFCAACGANSSSGTDSDANKLVPFGVPQDGIATFYGATGAGNCSYDPSSDRDIAAMNQEQYSGSAACGECVQVTGPRGIVTVRIVDRCPECLAGHLDLSQEAFAKVGNPVDGIIDITWVAVPCPVGGNVSYRIKEGSSPWWTAIQVRNHRLPIQSLAYNAGRGWVNLPRMEYNYFVAETGIYTSEKNGSRTTGAFKVRITAIDGQVLEDTLPGINQGQVLPGSSQFR